MKKYQLQGRLSPNGIKKNFFGLCMKLLDTIRAGDVQWGTHTEAEKPGTGTIRTKG